MVLPTTVPFCHHHHPNSCSLEHVNPISKVLPTIILASSIPKKSRASCCSWQNWKKRASTHTTKTHMLWMTHLGLFNFFNQSWDLDILGNGELAGNRSIIGLSGSMHDDFLRGWHVRRYQNTRINLRIFDLKLVSIFGWQNISLYNEK